MTKRVRSIGPVKRFINKCWKRLMRWRESTDSIAGFMVSHIVVMLFLLAPILVPLTTCAVVRYTTDNETATEAASKWAERVDSVTSVECVKWDSNMDGYVSCTVYRSSGDPLYIECVGSWTLNDGCRGRGRQ